MTEEGMGMLEQWSQGGQGIQNTLRDGARGDNTTSWRERDPVHQIRHNEIANVFISKERKKKERNSIKIEPTRLDTFGKNVLQLNDNVCMVGTTGSNKSNLDVLPSYNTQNVSDGVTMFINLFPSWRNSPLGQIEILSG